jgi:DNA topoisomerase-2
MADQDLDREFEQISQLDHVKRRPNMYIGSISLQKNIIYILNEQDKFVLTNVEFSPGLIKIFDEILVNAIDHFTNYPKLVKSIDVEFNVETGEISVRNDGPGISVIKVKNLKGDTIYKPQAIFSEFLGGDNLGNNADKIVGGCNGLGSKVTNAFSKYFMVETFDGKKNMSYKQTFRDRLTVIDEPDIDEYEGDNESASYTEIKFLPDYVELGYPEYNQEIGEVIKKIFEARVYQTVAFVSKECVTSYNLETLKFEVRGLFTEFEQFLQLFITNDYGIYTTTLVHPDNKALNIKIGLGISDGKFTHSSIINGISVYEGGTHIKYISDEIVKNLKSKVEQILTKTKSKFNANFILNNLFVLVICSVASPEFNSQGKEKLTTPIDKFQQFKFKEKEWKKIWELLEPHVTESILGKLKDKVKTRVTRGKIFLTKGADAKFAGDKKKSKDCSLFIAEGDSALGLLETGINHKKTELDRDYYGTWSIQGVCPNARKEVTTVVDIKNNCVTRVRNDKLRDNKRFDELVRLVGLDYEKTYDPETVDGCEEFKTLRYGRIVVATDADTDGKGMIFGLIINFVALFWPKLITRGYLKRFNTPIIRAYPNNAKLFVKEFYALHNYDDWINSEFSGDNELAATKYDIKYYKGLAGNSASEIKPMFNDFEKKLNTYLHDTDAQNNLEVYFGKDTTSRKEALSTPVSLVEIAFCDNTLDIPVSQFLKTDVKEFQRDNIIRKLPHIMDGMVPSRRKTFFGARLNKKMATSAIKVVNFTGEVISKTGYTHGDASLSGTIIKMAQSFVGAKNLPLLIGVGNFGSRRMGGSDHGSPRYVSIKLNKILSSALYPPQDDFLLKYMFEDGTRVEPEYYVPIVPMAVLESMQIPATGWRVKIWARDFDAVLKNVRKMVSGKINKCRKLELWLRGNNCNTRIASDGSEYLIGKYTYDAATNIVSISDLPLSVYNKRYINNIAFNKDKTLIKELKNVQDYSNYDESTNIDQVDIQFELSPGAMDVIKDKYNTALKAGKSILSEKKPEKKLTQREQIIEDTASEIDNDLESNADLTSVTSEEPIEDYVVDPLFDPIEEFFKLRLKIDSDINVIDKNGDVREITYYGSIVNIWFMERKKLYIERTERYIILSKLMIKFLENVVRFADERDNLNITNKTLEKDFNNILKKNKYDTFNRALLMSPKYCKVSDLEKSIINGDGASYDYIISLTYKSLLKESCVKRVDELKAEKLSLENLLADSVAKPTDTKFTGQIAWLAELEILEQIVHNGIAKGWDLKKNQPNFE